MSELKADEWATLIDRIEDYAIFRLDVGGHVLTWNQGAQKIKGYTAAEILGSHFSRFYLPQDLETRKPERELEIATRDGRVEDEGWRVRKDGTTFWANVVITALRDDQGVLKGFAKVTRDLSVRMAAEESLRRSEERFRLLVEAVSDYAIYMLDPSGLVTTWNAGAQKVKGYRADEIIGRNFSSFFRPEDVRAGKPEKELEIALRDGRFEEEGYRVRKDGRWFWANVVVTPMRDEAGALLGFAKVTRDLTQRIEAERTARELVREQAARTAAQEAEHRIRDSARAAREAAQRAEEANRVKDEFLATVSHELRTPLNAIVGWAALLRARSTDPSLARGLEVIHRNAFAQSKIIDDILDVSRIITGKLRLDLAPVDLVSIVRAAIEVVLPSVTAKGITLSFVPPDEDFTITADPERLQQVAWNLLSNAVKFSGSGGLVIISLTHSADHYELSVRDTGNGIDPAFLPFVFDRFKQADSSVTRRVGGLGLGLAIVRHLVELHGGEVRAESPGLGQGATFTIRLPVQRATRASDIPNDVRLSSAELHGQPGVQLHGARLLIVDDEEDARELARTILSDAGAEVQTADSAASAIEAVRSFKPQLIISDIGMPEEDGYSLLQRIHALPEGTGIPAIAMTAFVRGQDKARALTAGFTAHLAKPVLPDDLLHAVAHLLPTHPLNV
jgi:PAS domain S-box-containing protein